MAASNSPAGRTPGQITHGAYAIERRIRGDEIDKRTRLGRRVHALRLRFAHARGYATWTETPPPVQEAIRNAVRLALFNERIFSPFWTGGEVPRIFLTASENLRRQLGDLGLDPVPLRGELDRWLNERSKAKEAKQP